MEETPHNRERYFSLSGDADADASFFLRGGLSVLTRTRRCKEAVPIEGSFVWRLDGTAPSGDSPRPVNGHIEIGDSAHVRTARCIAGTQGAAAVNFTAPSSVWSQPTKSAALPRAGDLSPLRR